MDQTRFDTLTKELAATTSRRRALKLFATVGIAGLFDLSPIGAAQAAPYHRMRVGIHHDCKQLGDNCTGSGQGDCCDGVCDPDLNYCCRKAGNSCYGNDYQCCGTLLCIPIEAGVLDLGSCQVCVYENHVCRNASDCCGTLGCPNGTCVPCLNSGGGCKTDGDCCGDLVCRGGTCVSP